MAYKTTQTVVTFENDDYVKYYAGDEITSFVPEDYILRSGVITEGPIAPVVVTPIVDQSNAESDVVSLDVSGNFSDSGTLTFTATGLPTTLTISSAGVISGTIDVGQAASSPFTVEVTASDGTDTVSDTFTWTVTA